jgi:hypothetical protein
VPRRFVQNPIAVQSLLLSYNRTDLLPFANVEMLACRISFFCTNLFSGLIDLFAGVGVGGVILKETDEFCDQAAVLKVVALSLPARCARR